MFGDPSYHKDVGHWQYNFGEWFHPLGYRLSVGFYLTFAGPDLPPPDGPNNFVSLNKKRRHETLFEAKSYQEAQKWAVRWMKRHQFEEEMCLEALAI